MTPEASSLSALAGMRVLEVGADPAVAFAGLVLAGLGASVTHVDRPEDTGSTNGTAGIDLRWASLARGKRSAVLDLDSPTGAAALTHIARGYDVVLVDTTPIADHLADALRGEKGPTVCVIGDVLADDAHAGGRVPELVVEALSGLADLTGHEDGPPMMCAVPVCAMLAGLYAVIAVLAVASSGVHAGGSGNRVIAVAELDATLATMAYLATGYLSDGAVPHRTGTGHPNIAPYGAFRAADGEFVAAPFTQRFWRGFCRAVDRTELVEDPRYADLAARGRHRRELLADIEARTSTRDSAVWLAALSDNDVPCGPVLTTEEAGTLTDSLTRGLAHDVDVPTVGGPPARLRLPAMPFVVEYPDGTRRYARNAAPPVPGAHTDAVRAEEAGT